jgi:hypothetical protein
MRLPAVVMSMALVAGATVWAQVQRATHEPGTAPVAVPAAIEKGARWLASVQGADGGWGQDGGGASSTRADPTAARRRRSRRGLSRNGLRKGRAPRPAGR